VIAEIETARLLRQWREENLDTYARICAGPEVVRHFPYVLTREESEAQVAKFVRHCEECGFGLWVVE
jgi:hypothetical protein